MTETIITAIITALCTGGLTWLFTLRYTRKQAEADAMKSVQEVYQELIEDMKNDRKELKNAYQEQKNGLTKWTTSTRKSCRNVTKWKGNQAERPCNRHYEAVSLRCEELPEP